MATKQILQWFGRYVGGGWQDTYFPQDHAEEENQAWLATLDDLDGSDLEGERLEAEENQGSL